MATLPKLHEMLVTALSAAAADSSMLLGCEIASGDAESDCTTRSAYFEQLEDPSFVVGIESKEDYEGCLYLVTTIRDAIHLSSVLLGIPPARISEKRRLAIIEDDDVDAFSEIVNQIIGSFNLALKSSLPKKAHLKQLAMGKYIPPGGDASADELLPEGDLHLFRSQLSISGQALERFDLLIPQELANLFDLQNSDVQADESAEAEVAVDEPAAEEAVDDTPQPSAEAVLVLDNSAADRDRLCTILSANGFRPIGIPFDADLKGVLARDPVAVVLVGMSHASDHELSIGIKVNASASGTTLPIIMCAPQWTRSSVLRAMKYGARDICLKQCDSDELVEKVSRLLQAA